MAIRDPTPVSSSLQTRLELYRMMYLIRRAEEILMAFCVGFVEQPVEKSAFHCTMSMGS